MLQVNNVTLPFASIKLLRGDKIDHYTRQQIFVYLLFLVLLYVFGIADADFDVSFCMVSTILKIFATD